MSSAAWLPRHAASPLPGFPMLVDGTLTALEHGRLRRRVIEFDRLFIQELRLRAASCTTRDCAVSFFLQLIVFAVLTSGNSERVTTTFPARLLAVCSTRPRLSAPAAAPADHARAMSSERAPTADCQDSAMVSEPAQTSRLAAPTDADADAMQVDGESAPAIIRRPSQAGDKVSPRYRCASS